MASGQWGAVGVTFSTSFDSLTAARCCHHPAGFLTQRGRGAEKQRVCATRDHGSRRARGRLRRPVARPRWRPGEQVPRRQRCLAPAPSGPPRLRRTRKPAVPAGHGNSRKGLKRVDIDLDSSPICCYGKARKSPMLA